jgi:hypothetical protein
MPIIIGSEKCPHMYYEEIAESYETELCDLDESECPLDCSVYQAIRKRRGIVDKTEGS